MICAKYGFPFNRFYSGSPIVALVFVWFAVTMIENISGQSQSAAAKQRNSLIESNARCNGKNEFWGCQSPTRQCQRLCENQKGHKAKKFRCDLSCEKACICEAGYLRRAADAKCVFAYECSQTTAIAESGDQSNTDVDDRADIADNSNAKHQVKPEAKPQQRKAGTEKISKKTQAGKAERRRQRKAPATAQDARVEAAIELERQVGKMRQEQDAIQKKVVDLLREQKDLVKNRQ